MIKNFTDNQIPEELMFLLEEASHNVEFHKFGIYPGSMADQEIYYGFGVWELSIVHDRDTTILFVYDNREERLSIYDYYTWPDGDIEIFNGSIREAYNFVFAYDGYPNPKISFF